MRWASGISVWQDQERGEGMSTEVTGGGAPGHSCPQAQANGEADWTGRGRNCLPGIQE